MMPEIKCDPEKKQKPSQHVLVRLGRDLRPATSLRPYLAALEPGQSPVEVKDLVVAVIVVEE